LRLRLAFVLLALILLAPPAPAQPSPSAGGPWLSDPSGDVRYAEEYVGPHDRDYIDLREVRFEYANETDVILLFVQIQDTRPLQDLPPDRYLQCRLNASVVGGNAKTIVTFVWEAAPQRDRIGSSVTWTTMPSEGIAKNARYGRLDHEFLVEFREQGAVQFQVPRAPLLQLGNELRDIRARCDEWWEPPLHGPAFIQQNHDEASGSIAFSLTRLEPAAQAAVPERWEIGTAWIAPAIGVGVLVRLLVAWWLYARIDRHDVLKNPARARVFDLIQQNPGIRQRQLMRLSDMAWGTLVHHLRTLQSNGLIRKVPYEGFSCYFPADADSKAALPVAALRTPTARWIFEQIQRRPGLTAGQLARERNVHASSISFHVRRLIDAGLLVRTRTRAGFELRAAETPRTPPPENAAASGAGTG
jgi:DNA-binding MarR family transcriptional regulator